MSSSQFKLATYLSSEWLTLVIRMRGDQVLARYLEGNPLMWMMLLHLHFNLNADDESYFINAISNSETARLYRLPKPSLKLIA